MQEHIPAGSLLFMPWFVFVLFLHILPNNCWYRISSQIKDLQLKINLIHQLQIQIQCIEEICLH